MDKFVYNQSNHTGVGVTVVLDRELCIGCNNCVEACRQHIYLPNKTKGEPPSLINVEECWFDGCCVLSCPVPGALKVIHPLLQRVGWKRKETGEYYRIGMKNPPSPNKRPPIDWKKKRDTLPYSSGKDAVSIFDK